MPTNPTPTTLDPREQRGILDYATTCAASSSTSDMTAAGLLELINMVKAKLPPKSEILVKVEMAEQTWREFVDKLDPVRAANEPWMPRQICEIPVMLTIEIPPGCYSMEYADGHADMVTPCGQFRWKEANHAG
jgi:hypothetical protein